MLAGLGGGDAGVHAAAGVGRGGAASLWVNEDGGGGGGGGATRGL
jgi:hypothetical protein